MGKKKFIDKKKAVKLTLMDAPSRYENNPETDRAFYRIDNNPVLLDTFGYDPIYADAPEDSEFNDDECGVGSSGPLPEHVRKEILELGFPDDGYNYLIHMREMRNTETGAMFVPVENPNHGLHLQDVKAYDASRVHITAASSDPVEKSIFTVASNTISLKGRRVDPEVAALLDDSDMSRFGSDVEELEEDFVIQANVPLEGETVGTDNTTNLVEEQEGFNIANGKHVDNEQRNNEVKRPEYPVDNNPRVRRFLDDQFDLLESQEYGSDDDYDGDHDGYYSDCMDEEAKTLADNLKHVLKGNLTDNIEFDGKYKVPVDLLNNEENEDSKELEVVVRRCAEYAKMYENEDEKEDLVVVEESSDEAEVWDCETVVSTYSNFDNHPGKIADPIAARRKKIVDTVSGAFSSNSNMITLRGKAKLPVDYLPYNKKPVAEKVKGIDSEKAGLQKRKQHGQESKEEKKERKAAVKEERRAARVMKKEIKGLYKSEAQRAQRVAAISGPSSVHIM